MDPPKQPVSPASRRYTSVRGSDDFDDHALFGHGGDDSDSADSGRTSPPTDPRTAVDDGDVVVPGGGNSQITVDLTDPVTRSRWPVGWRPIADTLIAAGVTAISFPSVAADPILRISAASPLIDEINRFVAAPHHWLESPTSLDLMSISLTAFKLCAPQVPLVRGQGGSYTVAALLPSLNCLVDKLRPAAVTGCLLASAPPCSDLRRLPNAPGTSRTATPPSLPL